MVCKYKISLFEKCYICGKRKKIYKNPPVLELKSYPTVTVVVPCYNEAATIDKTVASLLEMDYPKDKLKLFLIDDGSKDNTWDIIREYDNGENIFSFTKPNGGKHTALNFALEKNNSEFFGCLDSDSLVHPQAL